MGQHGYHAIITNNKNQYPPSIRELFGKIENKSGNLPSIPKGENAYVISAGGHNSEGRLVTIINQQDDLEAIREVAAGKTAWANSMNAKLSESLRDEDTETSVVDEDVRVINEYQQYNGKAEYGAFASNAESYNCLCLSGTVAQRTGQINYPGYLSGVTPGFNKRLPASAWEPVPEWLLPV